MTTPAEAVAMVIQGGRGSRPASLDSPEAEKVLDIALALLVELTVAQDRIDRLEREMAALRQQDLATWKGAEPDEATRQEQMAQTEALQLRVLRPLIDPRTDTPR